MSPCDEPPIQNVSPVSDDIDRVAAEWRTSKAMDEVASDGFAQVDIDDLFGVPPAYPVPVGLQLLRAAVRDARASNPGLAAMLVVPLGPSENLVVRAPAFAEVASARWEYGPGLEAVGLYLLEPRVLAADEPAEEYRCHVDAQAVLGAGPSVYFRSWRPLVEAANGWEFNQAFYIRT